MNIFGRQATVIAAVLACAACGQAATTATDDAATGDSAADVPQPDTAFPKGFIWGAAIAGFQVDMGCPTLPQAKCDDQKSDW